MITKDVILKKMNTFAICAKANYLAIANSKEELFSLWQYSLNKNQPVMLLGGGSNVLFIDDFYGMIILNRIKGINITEDDQAWYLHIGAGEVWHDLVVYTLDKQMPGLENLALIPGYVGSAPIQNIGAYGVELQQLCEYVDILNLKNGNTQRINSTDCEFGYRESIFKHQFRESHAIIAVGLRLFKAWHPILSYGELVSYQNVKNVTAYDIFNTVCAIRRKKLPDTSVMGNSGSFFKNPVINAEFAEQLLTNSKYEPPCYPQPNGKVKLAASWLIDKCHLKGYKRGQAGVYHKQALVLINHGEATGDDIVALAREVRLRVAEKFSIWLEPEVRFIASSGEIDAVRALI